MKQLNLQVGRMEVDKSLVATCWVDKGALFHLPHLVGFGRGPPNFRLLGFASLRARSKKTKRSIGSRRSSRRRSSRAARRRSSRGSSRRGIDGSSEARQLRLACVWLLLFVFMIYACSEHFLGWLQKKEAKTLLLPYQGLARKPIAFITMLNHPTF